MSGHKTDSDASPNESDSDSSVQSIHSNDSQLSFEFTPENCDKRIEEFVQVTETNSALAQMFLQDRKWNVVRAVNHYFKEMRKKANKKRRLAKDSSSEDADDEDDNQDKTDKKKVKPSSKQPCSSKSNVATHESNDCTNQEKEKQKLFRHITWNIDGLNNKNLKIRTEAACNIIIKEKAAFVFLQEVTSESEIIIRQFLDDKFNIFSGYTDSAAYFTLTLVAKKPFIKIEGNEILNFKGTLMGRNIIKTNVTIENAKLCLLNTHLESTKDGADLRVQQLSFIIQYFKTIKPDITILAGGDLNLRDKELASLGGLPPGVSDAWEATGRRKEVEYTWDMLRNDNLPYYDPGAKRQFKPRMRFDRLFIRKTFPVHVEIVHFGMIGIERLKPYVCFPSDHWGIITSYHIFK